MNEHLFLSDLGAEILSYTSTVLFVVYLFLQVIKHRAMWNVYIPSCLAAVVTFLDSNTWAFAALNVYYVIMGAIGIRNYRYVAETAGEDTSGKILLKKLPFRDVLIALGLTIVGIPALYFLLDFLKDHTPLLDSVVTTLSIIGTWWLTKSYIQQWWLWIIADVFAIWMNLILVDLGYKDKLPFIVMFVFCIISSCVGLVIWSKKGKYVG
ncbi:MAG: nicotinamide mononucleotide transporter [Bacteroidales bacterium]|nr:nicotinamide mononucleotide transporter [Bacteroidales bacterium]